MTINDISMRVSAASPNNLNAGDTNVQLTLSFSPPLKNWSHYIIFSVTSDNPAISYIDGSVFF